MTTMTPVFFLLCLVGCAAAFEQLLMDEKIFKKGIGKTTSVSDVKKVLRSVANGGREVSTQVQLLLDIQKPNRNKCRAKHLSQLTRLYVYDSQIYGEPRFGALFSYIKAVTLAQMEYCRKLLQWEATVEYEDRIDRRVKSLAISFARDYSPKKFMDLQGEVDKLLAQERGAKLKRKSRSAMSDAYRKSLLDALRLIGQEFQDYASWMFAAQAMSLPQVINWDSNFGKFMLAAQAGYLLAFDKD